MPLREQSGLTHAETQGNEEDDVQEKGLSDLLTLLPSYLPFFPPLRLGVSA